MNDTQLETIEEIEAFLSGTQSVELIIEGKMDRYAWMQRTLIRLNYLQLSKAKKGIVMRYLGTERGTLPFFIRYDPHRRNG